VTELVTTLRRADSLVDRMRAATAAQGSPGSSGSRQQHPPAGQPVAVPREGSPVVAPARSWFAGRSVGVILLVLGTLCVLAAGAVFIAVAWMDLPLAVRALILILLTTGFGFLAQLALARGLQATAEAMSAIACGMLILDLAAGRRAGLPGLADLSAGQHEILAGIVLAAVTVAAALLVRGRGAWLWTLDAAVAVGVARAAIGALRLSTEGYGVPLVGLTVASSVLFVAWRRIGLPVAMWSTAFLGGLFWLGAVGVGTHDAADYGGGDIGRLTHAWPALTVALVAGLWSVRLTHAGWRRAAACLCLLPVLLVFEVVGWSHGWVVGASVMLAGYAAAALASARVPNSWSLAVGGAAAALGLSSLVGLLPIFVALGTRMSLAFLGSWRGPSGLRLGILSGDVGPWLLPLTALVVLGLLPEITVEGRHIHLGRHHAGGVLVATLGVLPIVYGAGFWASMLVLVVVALLLLWGARIWCLDTLLVLGLVLLAIMRVFAFYDALADALGWTLLALTCFVWAVTEVRKGVRAGFLTVAGLFALVGVAQWLTFAGVPRPLHGLVMVVVGSLGVLASQTLHRSALERTVAEGLSVTWAVAGLVMAEGSPSHGALELTIFGVALGSAAYLSEDRRRAGWVSGLLLTLASWIRLSDSNVQTVEWYTVPAATALLFYGVRRLRRDPRESTWRCLGPGVGLALTPSLWLALDEPVSWRGLFVAFASVSLVAVGVQVRLAAPFAIGVVSTGLLALRNIWPVAAFIPRWSLLFLIGGALLAVGMTWESRVNDVRAAGGFVRGLR